MELRQLEHFVAVVEEGQFTRAARRVHLVQSSLSASVQALERELETALLHRTNRTVQLTEAGRALLPGARRTLAAATSAAEDVDAIRGLVRGSLAIGYIQATAPIDLPARLSALRRRHPGITVKLRSTSVPRLVEAIADGELDLAVIDGPIAGQPIRTIPLAVDPIVLAVPHGHPWSRRRTINLTDLGDADFVEYQPRSGLRAMLDHACRDAGLDRRIVCEADTIPMLLDCVANAIGVALVPAAVPAADHRITSIKITPALPRHMLLAIPAERPPAPAAAAFLELITDWPHPPDEVCPAARA